MSHFKTWQQSDCLYLTNRRILFNCKQEEAYQSQLRFDLILLLVASLAFEQCSWGMFNCYFDEDGVSNLTVGQQSH